MTQNVWVVFQFPILCVFNYRILASVGQGMFFFPLKVKYWTTTCDILFLLPYLFISIFGTASKCIWHSDSNVTSRVIHEQDKWVLVMSDDRTFSLNGDRDYSLKALKGNMSITLVQSAFLLLSAGLSVYQLKWKIKGLQKQGINFRSLKSITLGRKHHFFNAAKIESSYIYTLN